MRSAPRSPLLTSYILFASMVMLCSPRIAWSDVLPEKEACLADRQSCFDAVTSPTLEATNQERIERAAWLCDKQQEARQIAQCKELPESRSSADMRRHDCEQDAKKWCNTHKEFERRFTDFAIAQQSCNAGMAHDCLQAALLVSPNHVTYESLESTLLYFDQLSAGEPLPNTVHAYFSPRLETPEARLMPEPETASQLLARGCELGSKLSCQLREDRYPDALAGGTRQEALKRLQAQCETGTSGSCQQYAAVFLLAHDHTSIHDEGWHRDAISHPPKQSLSLTLERGCRSNEPWACDRLFSRAMRGAASEDADYFPELARQACASKTGELACLALASSCLDPYRTSSCSSSQIKRARTSLAAACKKGGIESCSSLARACEDNDFDSCQAIALPSRTSDGVAMCSGQRLMCYNLMENLEYAQGFSEGFAEELSPKRSKLQEFITALHLDRCTREGICLPDKGAAELLDLFSTQKLQELSTIQEQYRSAIKTQCLDRGGACNVWASLLRTAEEMDQTQAALTRQCQDGGIASSCMRAALNRPQGDEYAVMATRYCTSLDLSPCPLTQASKSLEQCLANDTEACDALLAMPPGALALTPEQRTALAGKMCQLGDLDICKSITQHGNYTIPLAIRRDAHLQLCAAGVIPERHCTFAPGLTSANLRIKEFTTACFEQDEHAACVAAEILSQQSATEPLHDANPTRRMRLVTKLCAQQDDTYCEELFGAIHLTMTSAEPLFATPAQYQTYKQDKASLLEELYSPEMTQQACSRGVSTACEVLALKSEDNTQLLKTLWMGCEANLDPSDQTRRSGAQDAPCNQALKLDADATVKHFRNLCTTSQSSPSCYVYGKVNASALSTPEQRKRAATTHVKGCKTGVMADCFASVEVNPGAPLVKTIGKERLLALLHHCRDDDSAMSCPRSFDADTSAELAPFFQSACEDNKASYCEEVLRPMALAYIDEPVQFTPEQIKAAFQACEAGALNVCQWMIDYFDPRVYEWFEQRVQAITPDRTALTQRDRFIDAFCQQAPDHSGCLTAQGARAYLSDDLQMKQSAHTYFTQACVAPSPHDNVEHACVLSAQLTPYMSLPPLERTRVAATWFIRSKQYGERSSDHPTLATAWFHPGIMEAITSIQVYSRWQDLSILDILAPHMK